MSSRRLKPDEREAIKEFLLENSVLIEIPIENRVELQVKRGYKVKAALNWKVNKKTIETIWNRCIECRKKGVSMDVSARYHGNDKPKSHVDKEKMQQIPLESRTTIRQLSASYGVCPTQIWNWKKEGELRAATSTVHPTLTDSHKLKRMVFCLESLFVNQAKEVQFKPMDHTIHIDEKWFYMQRLNQRWILMPGEEVPYTSTQTKHYVPKQMFLSCISRPIFGDDGECLFDGKIGIFAFDEQVAAQRSSVNRPRGTLEWKPIARVTREVIKEMIVTQVIPAIKLKWPGFLSKDILIQQDNARPHFGNDDPVFRAAASGDGFNINLVNQPAKSPETNVNDLGFFASIQSLQQKLKCKNFVELKDAVQKSFVAMEPSVINKVFLSLQQHLIEMMKAKGHNNYKLPHMGKDKLEAMGKLPRELTVDTQLTKECIEYLLHNGEQINNPLLLAALE